MKRNKKAKPLSLRQRLHEAIRDIYPSKHYSIEFQSGVISGVRLHQEWDDYCLITKEPKEGEWSWTGHYQEWKGGLGFGHIKDGDDFCLQINRRHYDSERVWGWEAGNSLEGYLYVTVENENFTLKAG